MRRIAVFLILPLSLLITLTACLGSCQETPPVSPGEATEPSREETTGAPAEAETKPPPTSKPEPEPAAPDEVVESLLANAKAWDVAAIDAHLPDGSTIKSYVPPEFDSIVSSLLSRMEYTVGEAAVTGNAAAVEVELTTADTEDAVESALGKIVAKVAFARLTGQTIDDYTPLIDDAVRSIDVDTLPTRTAQTTAHMIRGADGEWKLDVKDEANLPLLNAATGGAVDIAKKVSETADAYGIKLN